jgi:hypothetical protein
MTVARLARFGRSGGLCAAVLALAAGAGAQARKGPQGDDYESIVQLPDWSGVWVVPFAAFAEDNVRVRQPDGPYAPRLAGAAADAQAVLRTQMTTGRPVDGKALLRQNAELCLPIGMPNVMRYAFGIEFLFTPGRVTILLEQDGATRRVHTDGRRHDSDAVPSYLGESIGYWDDGTLVVDTIAISAKAELLAGVRSSGQAHVVEKIRLDEQGKLRIDTAIEDPVALATPWHTTRTYERSSVQIAERVCLDNNRDVGEGDPDLTPPASQ